MTTGMIIIAVAAVIIAFAVAAVIIAFAACANAAGTNATNVATSAEKSSKIGKQIGKEYYDSIPTGGTELEEFMAIGGTFIMPAVNSTHLYREIKKVYDKLPEDVARYLALQINSGAARGEFPNDALIKLVKKHSAENWRELCMDYTWEWSSRVGGIGPKNVPAEMKSDADKKADAAIIRAEEFIRNGNKRYEEFLRGIPQWRIMQVLMEADKISFMRQTVQNANVLTRGELDKYIGMDAVESIKGISVNEEEKLADLIESNVLLHIKSNNPNIAKVSKEELMSKPMVVDAFRAVVVAWLIYVSLSLSFGRVREDAIRDALNMRNNFGHLSFEYIRGLLVKNISAISVQMKRYAVDEVIERMRKQIDKQAMGNQNVVVDKELYKRKIEPRLQQYWKKVKEVFTMSEKEVADRMDEISRKYGDFSEALTDIKEGKGSEGVVPTEETILERDLAQLEYVALQRFGALAEKDLGFVADKVSEVAQDITLARRRLKDGYPLSMIVWSRWKIFEEFRWNAWGESVTDVMLMAKYGSFMAVWERVWAKKMSADLIDFYDDDELLVQSIGAVVARRALKSSGFEEVRGAFEKAYHTIDVVFSREFWKREGQRLLWQLIRGDAYCCSPMLDFAYEKVVVSLEQSEELKRNRIALWERKRAEERAKFSYRVGRFVGKIRKWFG